MKQKDNKFFLFVLSIVLFINIIGCVELETNVSSSAYKAAVGMKPQDVKSWLYQLQNINLRRVSETKFDLVVTDYAKEGDAATEYRNNQIVNFKKLTGKIVLSYISIGEAEDYRFYWDSKWLTNPPSWLDKENKNWEGNYKVKFWDPEWQKIIFSYIDRIIDEGFDGLYLDIIDAYQYYLKQNPHSEQDMITFVSNIAYYCRVEKGLKDFLIIPQNACELVTNQNYLHIISGIAQEETYFRATDIPSEDTAYNEKYLDIVHKAGKIVLTVDYCSKPENIKKAYKKAADKGYIEYCTVVDLDKMIINKGE